MFTAVILESFSESGPFRVKTRLFIYLIAFIVLNLCFQTIPDILLSHLSPEATAKGNRIYRRKFKGSNLFCAFEIV